MLTPFLLLRAEPKELSGRWQGELRGGKTLQDAEVNFDGNADGDRIARTIAGGSEAPGLNSSYNLLFQPIACVAEDFDVGGPAGRCDGQLEQDKAREFRSAGVLSEGGRRAVCAFRIAQAAARDDPGELSDLGVGERRVGVSFEIG